MSKKTLSGREQLRAESAVATLPQPAPASSPSLDRIRAENVALMRDVEIAFRDLAAQGVGKLTTLYDAKSLCRTIDPEILFLFQRAGLDERDIVRGLGRYHNIAEQRPRAGTASEREQAQAVLAAAQRRQQERTGKLREEAQKLLDEASRLDAAVDQAQAIVSAQHHALSVLREMVPPHLVRQISKAAADVRHRYSQQLKACQAIVDKEQLLDLQPDENVFNRDTQAAVSAARANWPALLLQPQRIETVRDQGDHRTVQATHTDTLDIKGWQREMNSLRAQLPSARQQLDELRSRMQQELAEVEQQRDAWLFSEVPEVAGVPSAS